LNLPQDERPTAIFSSPYCIPYLFSLSLIFLIPDHSDRCLQTVQPTAKALNLPIYVEHGPSFIYEFLLASLIRQKKQRTFRMVFSCRTGNRSSSTSRFRYLSPIPLSPNRSHLVLYLVSHPKGRNRIPSTRSIRWVSGRLPLPTRRTT